MSEHRLLIVEDSDEDFQAIQWALGRLERTLPLDRCVNGDDAIDWLSVPPHWPSLVLLDLNLPGTDGREVLGALRADPRTRTLPLTRAAPARPRLPLQKKAAKKATPKDARKPKAKTSKPKA